MKLNCLRNNLYWIAVLAVSYSCDGKVTEVSNEPEPNTIPESIDVNDLDLSWMIGKWRDSTTWAHTRAQILEHWKMDGNILSGEGWQVKNGLDTSLVEEIDIDLNQRPIVFKAMVDNQNQNESIIFELKSYGIDSVYFENLAHTFPQMIIYRMINEDTIHATVAGSVSGSGMRRQTSVLCRY